MLIKWGSIVVKGSGKLGGHVFSSGPGGASIHTLARARNPQTKYQMDVRSRFTRLSQDWSNLSETERQSWYDAETSFSRTNRFGDVISLSAKNLYESLNSNRNNVGLVSINTAPMPKQTASNKVNIVQVNISNERIVMQGVFESNALYVIVASPPVSQGSRFVGNMLRQIQVATKFSGGALMADEADRYSNYVDKFGQPQVGDKIFIGAFTVNSSGQKSTDSVIIAIVEA